MTIELLGSVKHFDPDTVLILPMALGVAFGEYLGSFLPFFSTGNILISVPVGTWAWTLSGGQVAAVLAILAKKRGDVSFIHQSLFYPVTDAGQNTPSYREFAEGFHLRGRFESAAGRSRIGSTCAASS